MEYADLLPSRIFVLGRSPEFCDLLLGILGMMRMPAKAFAEEGPFLESLADRGFTGSIPRLLIARHPEPGESAATFVRRVRERSGSVPIILIGGETSRFLDPDAWKGEDAVIQLAEPFSVDDLIWIVRKLLA